MAEPIPEVRSIEELVGRESLRELCRSTYELFGVSVRILSARDSLLADVHREAEVCTYVNDFPSGRRACGRVVGRASSLRPEQSAECVDCFVGARYVVEPVVHEGRPVGRVVFGPYRHPEPQVGNELTSACPEADPAIVRERLRAMPAFEDVAARRITAHLRRVLELLALSGYRALAAQQLQIASVRQSYRELAEKNEKLEKAYARLQELDRLKSNFLATISHELRTPLTSILGYAEMLSSGMAGEMSEEQLEFARTIQAKGEQLLRLISSLLDLTRLEQGAVQLRREAVDVRRLLEEVRSTVQPKARDKGVRLQVECHCGQTPHVVHADEVALGQVLTNLTDNAIKFTPEGGSVRLVARPVEIETEPEASAEQPAMGLVLFAATRPGIEFVVEDTGIGIPADALEHIFDAFYQVDGSSTRVHQGAGLGLSIVKRLVDAMDGHIEVDSEPGRGTRFRVVVPDAPPSDEPG